MPSASKPELVQLAAALSRNQDTLGEPRLRAIIRANPGSPAARLAHLLLSRSYLRRGQYAQSLANLDAWSTAFPNDEAVRQEKTDIEQFRGLPDQVNDAPLQFASTHGDGNDFTAPALINGTPVNFLLDTGAWLSVMTEAEAKRANLVVRDSGGVIGDSSGKGVKVRTAIVDDVSIGTRRLRNVSFAILPDDGPWQSMPAGRGGILGVPILLALECVQWTRDGAWRFGCAEPASLTPAANLVFFANHLLLAADVQGKRQFVALDTGAETTDLNANFARDYAADIERSGTKSTTDISGMGGTAVIESVTLPEVRVDIAGTHTLLRQAHVTKQDNTALGGRCCVGNIGLDLLLQSGTLTIDFRRMTLTLR